MKNTFLTIEFPTNTLLVFLFVLIYPTATSANTIFLDSLFQTCTTFVSSYKTTQNEGILRLGEHFYAASFTLSQSGRYSVLVHWLIWYPVFNNKFLNIENMQNIPFKYYSSCISVISSFFTVTKATWRTDVFTTKLHSHFSDSLNFKFLRKSPIVTIVLVPIPKFINLNPMSPMLVVRDASLTIGVPILFIYLDLKSIFILDRFRSDESFYREREIKLRQNPFHFWKHTIDLALIQVPLDLSATEILTYWKTANHKWNMIEGKNLIQHIIVITSGL